MALIITTWNVQNFTSSAAIYDEKRTYLTTILKNLKSDVAALQEILNEEAVKELAQDLDFNYFVASPDGRGNRVAFIVRKNIQVEDVIEIKDWDIPTGIPIHSFDDDGNIILLSKFRRPALQITIEHDGEKIDIITAHLKSKLLTFGGHFSTTDESLRALTAFFALECRAAEAATLRSHATKLLNEERNVILLGDLNDGAKAATTQIIYGPPGSQLRGPDDKTNAGGAFQKADKGDNQRLFNVTQLVPEDIRWSRKHNSEEELLDHILVSWRLLPRSASTNLRQVPDISILNADTPNMIGEHPTSGTEMPDHAPVTAKFA